MRTEDGYIIRKCLDGDSAAFGFLVDKYKESVYAFAYSRLGNFHDAEDVTQEVFISAYQKLRTLRRWDNFLAWLYSITSNLCKNWIRAQSRRPDHELMEDKDLETLDAISIDAYRENLARESLNESLQEALDSLPEMHRQVLILYYLGGMSSKEIARFLGASPMNILQRLHRARLQLKEEMLAMMGAAFERQGLSGGFTLRIVEAVKRMKIQPVPRMNGLPWGVSLATGIIIAILNLGSHLSLPGFMNPFTSPSPSSEAAKTELAQMPVEVLRVPKIPIMSDMQANTGSGPGLPDQQNTFFLAPGGEGDVFPEKPAGQLGKGWVSRIAYSPDGKLVAIAGGSGIYLHDAVTLDEIGLLGKHSVYSIAFSPDGRMLASGGHDNIIRFWDVQEQRHLAELKGHTNWIESLAFSPDGRTLASGGGDRDHTVRLWDVQSRKHIAVLGTHTGAVSSLAFSLDGEMLCSSGYQDNMIHIWDVRERKEAGILEGHTADVLSIAFSPDGRTLASGSADETIRLWDIKERRQVGTLQGHGHTNCVRSVAFSPDGKTLASAGGWGENCGICLWDVAERRQVGLLSGTGSSVAFSPDGKSLASIWGSGGDRTVRFWDVQEQMQVGELKGYTGAVTSIAFSRDGKTMASAGYDGFIILWDVDEQKQTGVLKYASDVRSVAFSPDGKTLASGDYEGTIHLWDVHEQKLLAELKGHTSWIRALAFSPDGKILASGGMEQDNTIRLWDVKEQKQIRELLGTARFVHSIAFSPDGKILASVDGLNSMIRIWDVQKMEQIETFSECAFVVSPASVAFSPDGRTLAAGNFGGTICLWNIQDKEPLEGLTGHTDCVRSIAFSPDGKWLASGSWDTTIRIWDVKDRSVVAVLKEHTSYISSVAFSPDGKWFASGSDDGTVQLWEVNLRVPGTSVEPSEKQLGTWGAVKKTELLQNFPNPFNPETWIPYQLAEDSDVAISIYNVSGQLVRKLNLGQKPSGLYLGREKAAYWDGRNEKGEPVASDVYFYVMETGESYAGVRKMVMVR